tara:strand:+ start:2168 stop:2623 length:456 start_codon:yes stop_codon:yes gene_type:complete
MRVVVKRVSKAEVFVEGASAGSIGKGLVILLGVDREDNEEDLHWMSKKIPQLRVFEDTEGKMNLNIRDVKGELAVISQFTLFGNVRKGTRPSFNKSANPEKAIPFYEAFVKAMEVELGKPVVTGQFGAMMAVDLVSDGPVTLVIDSKNKRF